MMIAFGMVLGVMTVGLILTPYLIVDEKESHTLEALLISPARTSHVLIGKSLVQVEQSHYHTILIYFLMGAIFLMQTSSMHLITTLSMVFLPQQAYVRKSIKRTHFLFMYMVNSNILFRRSLQVRLKISLLTVTT
ncbi:MAG: hypothetical protein GY786_13620 [Proteobacteria bacterium]|nr:hypothetical protein [Pseudomonadota bacterium]